MAILSEKIKMLKRLRFAYDVAAAHVAYDLAELRKKGVPIIDGTEGEIIEEHPDPWPLMQTYITNEEQKRFAGEDLQNMAHVPLPLESAPHSGKPLRFETKTSLFREIVKEAVQKSKIPVDFYKEFDESYQDFLKLWVAEGELRHYGDMPNDEVSCLANLLSGHYKKEGTAFIRVPDKYVKFYDAKVQTYHKQSHIKYIIETLKQSYSL